MAISDDRRFSNWSKLTGHSTQVLLRLVEERLVPAYLAVGFLRTSIYMNNAMDKVSGRELHLERMRNGEIDFATFNFDKHRRPAFQFHVGCRTATEDHAWIRSANVVKRSTQPLHFWGKPWWLPTDWWSEGMSNRVVDQLASKSPEVIAFIECGIRGSSLSNSS
jgi:hypothetical protein